MTVVPTLNYIEFAVKDMAQANVFGVGLWLAVHGLWS